MKKFQPVFIAVAVVFVMVMIIPTLLVIPHEDEAPLAKKKSDSEAVEASKVVQGGVVAVFRSSTQTVDTIPLEDYVVGVVATEMPADFEMEALKAQALSARTYIVKAKMNQPTNMTAGDVTDTVKDQVYKNDAELRSLWKNDYSWKIARIKKAVEETSGKVLTYNGQPITASFFSTSNGRTENSEDYWSSSLPYLRSVDSHWDSESPKFTDQAVFSVADVEAKLAVRLSKAAEAKEIAETAGNRVAKFKIGDKIFTGKEVREKLGLRSSDFTWKQKDGQIIIDTKGYGHGVGLSQYGANGMAKEGSKYKQIVAHYYSGVEISEASAFLPEFTAQK